jgi:hypothetical protein
MINCVLKINVTINNANTTLQIPLPFVKHFNIRPILFKFTKDVATSLQNLFTILDESALGLSIEVEDADAKIFLEVIEYVH